MVSSTGISVSVTQDWAGPLVEELSTLYRQKSQDTPWGGRWDVSQAYFAWKCAANPVLPSVAALARDSDRALCGAVTVTFKRLGCGDEKVLAGEIGDLYLQPRLRGTGVFADLVRVATDRARNLGADVVYCIPNRAGANALARTGIYTACSAAEHATWIVPLRPLKVMACRCPSLTPLSVLDGAIWPLVRALNAGASAACEVAMENALQCYRPAATEGLRLDDSISYLTYRTLAGTQPDAYRALVPVCMPSAAAVIIRKADFRGLPVLFGARLDAATPRVFGGQSGLLARYALEGDFAFAALWAPRRGAYAASLWRRGFLPAQRKTIMIASASSAWVLERLPQLRLDMLDSDKI